MCTPIPYPILINKKFRGTKRNKNTLKKTLSLWIYFRERGKKGERVGEKHQCERKTLSNCLSHAPPLGSETATQACAMTGN